MAPSRLNRILSESIHLCRMRPDKALCPKWAAQGCYPVLWLGVSQCLLQPHPQLLLHCWRWHCSVPAALMHPEGDIPALEASYHWPAFPHCAQNGFIIFLQPNFFCLSGDSPVGREEVVESIMYMRTEPSGWQSSPVSWIYWVWFWRLHTASLFLFTSFLFLLLLLVLAVTEALKWGKAPLSTFAS